MQKLLSGIKINVVQKVIVIWVDSSTWGKNK